MSNPDYPSAWAAYRDAVDELYTSPPSAMTERGEAEITPTADLSERAQTLVAHSQRLGAAAASGLTLPDAGQRELARLQLLAAAAMDLSVANDLAQHAEGGARGGVVERSAAMPATMAGIRSILSTPTEQGIQAVMQNEGVRERAALPTDPAAAKDALRAAATNALADVRADATAVGQAAFAGLVALPMPPIEKAASAVLGEVMVQVGVQVSGIVSKAAALVGEAIDKLLAALGKDAQDEARQQAAKWVKDLQGGTLFDTLLKRVYEADKLQQDIAQSLDKAASSVAVDKINAASQQVNDLAARFRKQKDTLSLVIRGLTFARPWLMTVQPWGPLGITAAYLVCLGYIVYSGGDYVDWFRTGTVQRLDFVTGVRTVVHKAVGA